MTAMRKKSFRISMGLDQRDAVAIVFHWALCDFSLKKLPNKITQKYCRDYIISELHGSGLSTLDDRSWSMGEILDNHDSDEYETYVDIARQIEEQVHKIYNNK